ncbi:transketolase [Sphingomonas sp. SORGH_AS 950]|uniref:transketolase n=1 Tax=Sphingomonas sp. SORGH_AS_0950 TaxID=3041792 RepID=UPI00278999AC|nr:transketolase [Sphingomonas sp. SORGH_AS_0950]MDQ1159508.1 transketolase [Sphingomonas sp. SORGH_AS_0950]
MSGSHAAGAIDGKSGLRNVLHEAPAARNIETWLPALTQSAAAVRRSIAETLFHTGGGHYGGSFSAVELLVTLYARHLRIDRDNLGERLRDQFILSKGHAAVALYAVLSQRNIADLDLNDYATFRSPLAGHPDMTELPGVDWSTGSLGQGLSAGLGMALGLRRTGHRVWVMLGDGECQEGQVWEAAMLAGIAAPDNLHAVVDLNRRQEFGWHVPGRAIGPIDPVPDMAGKWRAFGWRVLECDGHDIEAIDEACRMAVQGRGPSVILAATRKGQGSTLAQADPARYHCTDVSVGEHAAIMAELAEG